MAALVLAACAHPSGTTTPEGTPEAATERAGPGVDRQACLAALERQSALTRGKVASLLRLPSLEDYPAGVCDHALAGLDAGRIGGEDGLGLMHGLPSVAVVALFNPLARADARPLPKLAD
ncbi:hypothetical protein SAMN07250955_11162 [Arboricoccus pini]|uniref:Uncharacterized protein n=1 Tax=Arboricoccus pini TaxID=1963835 RepID=A0A212RNB4_9PROT|nr:hypothetical protein [Arboricoccus pini]SNB74027.1 hypothetical protein SAMN07250955_11162 [Arboricoccus pini]